MIFFVSGGTRSGKSAFAERLVSQIADGVPVTYVATARLDRTDLDHVERIRRHQQRRPSTWATVEAAGGDLATVVRATTGPVLVDSLGTWISGHHDFAADVAALVDALTDRAGDTVVVGEEVGSSLHAPTALGRRFVDRLGEANAIVSARSDRAFLVVAGRALELPGPSDSAPI